MKNKIKKISFLLILTLIIPLFFTSTAFASDEILARRGIYVNVAGETAGVPNAKYYSFTKAVHSSNTLVEDINKAGLDKVILVHQDGEASILKDTRGATLAEINNAESNSTGKIATALKPLEPENFEMKYTIVGAQAPAVTKYKPFPWPKVVLSVEIQTDVTNNKYVVVWIKQEHINNIRHIYFDGKLMEKNTAEGNTFWRIIVTDQANEKNIRGKLEIILFSGVQSASAKKALFNETYITVRLNDSNLECFNPAEFEIKAQIEGKDEILTLQYNPQRQWWRNGILENLELGTDVKIEIHKKGHFVEEKVVEVEEL